MDREKVVKALEFCTKQIIVDTCYGECPYAVADDEYRCFEMKQDALTLLKEQQQQIWELQDQVEYLTDKQEGKKFLVDSDGKITPLHEIVRCKDCKHATMTADGKMCKYCAMDTDDFGDQRDVYHDANWFCADGERREYDA